MDVDGYGLNSTVSMKQVVDQGTPGTRLSTTNSSSGYCGIGQEVTVYYQKNTSEIMQYSFIDEAIDGGTASSVTVGSPMPGVETYGQQYTKHFSGGEIFGIVLGALVAAGILFALIFACCRCLD
jgi:hypothetical protein